MAEEIITYFKADLSELEAAVSKGEKLIDGYEDTTNKATDAELQLGNAAGNAAAKVTMLGGATSKTATSEQQLAVAGNKAAASQTNLGAATEKSAAKLNIFQRIGQSISNTFKSITGGVKGFGDGAKTAFDKASVSGGKAGGVLQSLSGSLTSAVGSTGSLGGAFTALTGPIGIAVGAVSAFIANFSRLDSVQNVLTAISTQFDLVKDRLTSFEGFAGLFNSKEFAKDMIFSAQYAAALDLLEDKQRAVNVSNAEAEKQIAGINQKLRDKTLTEEERLAVAAEITAIETDRAKKEEDNLSLAVGLTQKLIEKKREAGIAEEDISDELKDQLAGQQAALLQAQTRRIQLTETVERRVNLIIEQGLNERNAAEAKATAAREKAAADAAKKEQERLAKESKIGELKGQILEITATVDKESLNDGLSEVDRKVAESDERFQKLAKSINDASVALRKMVGEGTPQADTPEGKDAINKINTEQTTSIQVIGTAALEEANKIRAIEAAKQLDIEQSTQERINEIGLSESEKRIASVEREYAELLDANERFIENKLQQDANRIELEAERDAEIRELKNEIADEEAAKEAARQEAYIEILASTTEQATALIAQAAAEGELESEKLAKALLGIALDALEKILLMTVLQIIANSTAKGAETGGAPGAAVGLIAGVVIGAIIKGLFTAVRSQVLANYKGDPYVEGTPQWSGRDGYLRRLDKGERVVTAKANQEHWEPLQAIHEGRFDNWLEGEFDKRVDLSPFALNLPDMDLMHSVNKYMDGDTGQRLAQSIMFPKYFDRNMVKATERTNQELQTNNTLLAVIVEQNKRSNKGHKRSW